MYFLLGVGGSVLLSRMAFLAELEDGLVVHGAASLAEHIFRRR